MKIISYQDFRLIMENADSKDRQDFYAVVEYFLLINFIIILRIY